MRCSQSAWLEMRFHRLMLLIWYLFDWMNMDGMLARAILLQLQVLQKDARTQLTIRALWPLLCFYFSVFVFVIFVITLLTYDALWCYCVLWLILVVVAPMTWLRSS